MSTLHEPNGSNAMATGAQTDMYPSRVSHEAMITKRLDPVVYADPDQGPISSEQIRSYADNGYLFLENFFTEEEVQSIRRELGKVLTTSRDSDAPEVVREPESEEVRSVFAVHRDVEAFRKLAQHPRLTAIVKHILGGDVYIHQSRINFKPGFTGKEFYWHSDFETWHVEDGMPRMRALSCSIALTDNHSYNGPLMVMPGSHQHYISCVGETPDENFKQSLRKQEVGVPDQDSLAFLVEKFGIDVPTGKAGSVLLFDCNVMHGSNSNITPHPRSNVFFVYNSVENRIVEPFHGKAARPEYIAHRKDQIEI